MDNQAKIKMETGSVLEVRLAIKELDTRINMLMNSVFADEITANIQKYPKSDPKIFDWVFCLQEKLPKYFQDQDGEYLIRHLARLVFLIGENILNYKNFITDGGSGILVEHFLSDFHLALSDQLKIKYTPPKEITIAGGKGSDTRVTAIEQAFVNEGVDLNQKTLFITEYIYSADSIEQLFKQVDGLGNVDLCSLGTRLIPREIKRKLNLAPGSNIYIGGAGVFFKGKTDFLGFQKDDEQEGAYLNVPDTIRDDDKRSFRLYNNARQGLELVAKALLPIISIRNS